MLLSILLILVLIVISTGVDLWIWNTFVVPIYDLPQLEFFQIFGILLIFTIVRMIIKLILTGIIKLFDKDGKIEIHF